MLYLVLALIVGLVVGYYIGKAQGEDEELGKWLDKIDYGEENSHLTNSQKSRLTFTQRERIKLGKAMVVGDKKAVKEAKEELNKKNE